MMRPVLFRAAALVALAAALLARPAAAQDKTPGPKLLPRTVYLYVSAPNVDTLKERVKGSAFGAMLKDPKLQPTYDQIKEKAAEAGGKVEQELGVSIGDLLKIPAGELSVGVFDVPGAADGGIGIVLILDYGKNESTVKTLLEKAEGALEKNGAKRTTQEFEGTEIVVYTKEGGSNAATDDDLDIEGDDNAGAAAGAANTVAWFQKDGRYVWGNGTAALEAVLARWDGKHDDTLASNEVYGYVAEKTRSDDRDPIFTWYADPVGAFQAFATRAQGGPQPLQMATAFLPMLGVTKVKAFGGSVDASTKEFDTISKAFLYVEQPATGVLGVFQFPPAELTPPEWVPESAAMYLGANWDVPAAVQAVKTLVDTFQGPGAFDQIMNRAANSPNAKVHPQKDLLDQLTGRLDMVNFPAVVPRNAPAGGPPIAQQPAVLAVGVKDEAKMKDLLNRLSQTQGFPGKKRDFQGTTIYELPMPNPAGGQATMAFAAAKGSLIFATDPARMEDVLRSGNAAPLAQSDAYKAIAEHMPDKVSMVSYSDQRDQLKSIYEALRSGQFAQQLEGFDFSVLPAFEDIAKYFRSSGSYALPDENGAMFVSFSLKLDE
jgi:hypothetical protein